MIEPARIQVRFADLDIMGHVNNSVYLSYFEYARVHYFNKVLGDKWDWKKFGCLVARNEINYHREVVLNQTPEIVVYLDEIGTRSFTISYITTVNGEVTTTGKTVMVCFDPVLHSTVEVTPEWRAALEKLEKSK